MIQRVLSCVCIFLLIVPTANSQAKSHNVWMMLQRLTRGDKVAIELKTGKTIKGEFDQSTDVALTISADNQTRNIDRNDVKKVSRISGSSVAKSTLTGTAVGAAAGATTGAAIGNNYVSRGVVTVVGALLFAIPGAAVGLVIGLHGRHHELIYKA
jgi:UPF0716 family protein affecting phage T7 exclusion